MCVCAYNIILYNKFLWYIKKKKIYIYCSAFVFFLFIYFFLNIEIENNKIRF